MSKMILGLVGQMACGKEAAKKYLEDKYQAKNCRFSTILRDILTRADVPISRENLQQLSTSLRQTFGEDLLAKAIAKDAEKITADVVVIDGVRRMADIKYLKELDGFYLVAIDVRPEVRYQRMVERNENEGDKDKSFEQFMADGQAEAEQEIPQVMKKADFTIDNNGDWDSFHMQIDKIIKELTTK